MISRTYSETKQSKHITGLNSNEGNTHVIFKTFKSSSFDKFELLKYLAIYKEEEELLLLYPSRKYIVHKIHRFVAKVYFFRTSQETHYVSATSPTG
jgi:hypothetical protein